MATIPTLVIGEDGVELTMAVNTPPSTTVNITGATVILCVLYPDQLTNTDLPCTVSSDGLYAIRDVQPTDFPIIGIYQIQLVATFTNGDIWKSAPISINIVGIC